MAFRHLLARREARRAHLTAGEDVLAHPNASMLDPAVVACSGATTAMQAAAFEGNLLWQHVYGPRGPSFPVDR